MTRNRHNRTALYTFGKKRQYPILHRTKMYIYVSGQFWENGAKVANEKEKRSRQPREADLVREIYIPARLFRGVAWRERQICVSFSPGFDRVCVRTWLCKGSPVLSVFSFSFMNLTKDFGLRALDVFCMATAGNPRDLVNKKLGMYWKWIFWQEYTNRFIFVTLYLRD